MNIRSIQPRRARLALVGVAAAALSLFVLPEAAGAYPPQPPTRSIAVEAAGQICNADLPYIAYEVSTTGYEPSEVAALTATVTVLDSDGAVASGPEPGLPLAGEVLYPGAAVDSSGQGIDWPGWELVGGVWVPDESDAHLTSGLTVQITVGSSTVTAPVQYPAESQACLSPSGQSSPPSGAAGAGGSASLPSTGGTDPSQILWIALGALMAGGLIYGAASFRRGRSAESNI
jgi:LPXTG-motif cell wall-anchored protein